MLPQELDKKKKKKEAYLYIEVKLEGYGKNKKDAFMRSKKASFDLKH